MKRNKATARYTENDNAKRESNYARKHRDQLRGTFNEESPLPAYRITMVTIQTTGKPVRMKVASGI